MSAPEGPATTALIARICEAHRDRDPDGPLVTVVDGAWGFCAGHGEAEHEWRVIEPTQRRFVEEQLAGG